MIQGLLAAIGVLAGMLWIVFVKGQSAEALLKNTDTKEKALDLEDQKRKLGIQADLEAMKRDLEAKNAEERKRNDIKPGDFN